MAIEGNVALAFGLVVAAGLCTCLGATLVFCTNLANHRVLSAALGASAGVMLYVSFAEIFTAKAVTAFVQAGCSNDEAVRYATFAFFSGAAATWLLGKLVHCLAHLQERLSRRQWRNAQLPAKAGDVEAGPPSPTASVQLTGPNPATPATAAPDPSPRIMAGPALAAPSGNIKDAEVLVAPAPVGAMHGACCSGSSDGGCSCCDGDGGKPAAELCIPKEENPAVVAVLQADHHATDLARMGMLTGLAVGLHNLPEGAATFVATLASPTAGVAIAIAIALHNIPEGVVVAMPIYYATGSKWRGFLWSFISGLAEPLGGLLAYAVLASNGMQPLAFGVMFGFVAGMMVLLSVRELLPTALRYDPEDRYASGACMAGMAVMAASLLLFRA